MATSFAASYNERLADEDRYRYRQAQAEGAALSGRLGLQSQILALSEIYKALRADGKLDEAAEIKRRVNLMVTEGK
jgi:hypothetical protein